MWWQDDIKIWSGFIKKKNDNDKEFLKKGTYLADAESSVDGIEQGNGSGPIQWRRMDGAEASGADAVAHSFQPVGEMLVHDDAEQVGGVAVERHPEGGAGWADLHPLASVLVAVGQVRQAARFHQDDQLGRHFTLCAINSDSIISIGDATGKHQKKDKKCNKLPQWEEKWIRLESVDSAEELCWADGSCWFSACWFPACWCHRWSLFIYEPMWKKWLDDCRCNGNQ